jgi:hypothetical protein
MLLKWLHLVAVGCGTLARSESMIVGGVISQRGMASVCGSGAVIFRATPAALCSKAMLLRTRTQ